MNITVNPLIYSYFILPILILIFDIFFQVWDLPFSLPCLLVWSQFFLFCAGFCFGVTLALNLYSLLMNVTKFANNVLKMHFSHLQRVLFIWVNPAGSPVILSPYQKRCILGLCVALAYAWPAVFIVQCTRQQVTCWLLNSFLLKTKQNKNPSFNLKASKFSLHGNVIFRAGLEFHINQCIMKW